LRLLAVAASLFCVSCGKAVGAPTGVVAPATGVISQVVTESLYATLPTIDSTASPFAGSVTIVNRDSATSRMAISLEGYLFPDKNELLAYIASIPPIFKDEPDYRKAWRFITARGYFYTPFTGSNDQHDPLLFINSVGYGYCDDFASVLAMVWQWQGYQSRVWWLSGHVVPEIRVNNRWMMFDSDIGIYYLEAHGEVTSVNDLSMDSDLILQPIDPIYDRSYFGYSSLLSGIYGSADDNRASPPVTGESRGMQFDLPAGAEFKFPVGNGRDVPLADFWALSSPLYYQAQMSVPKVETDSLLRMPLFVVGVSGTGKVEMGNRIYDMGSAELDAFFAHFFVVGNYAAPVKTLTVFAGATNVVIRMSLSAFVVNGPEEARVRIYQEVGAPPVEVRHAAPANFTKAPEAQVLSDTGNQLYGSPYKFISPRLVYSQLIQLSQ
jgi:hypothetical protein